MKPSDFQQHLQNTKNFLSNELNNIRTGRATSALVENIEVAAYEGSPALPIKELGSIAKISPQMLSITPWDKSIIAKIEKAVRDAGKGLNPVNDGENVKVPVPPVTEERRKELIKDVSRVLEDAKISIRTLRQNAMKAYEEQEENGVISEDDLFREKKRIEDEIKKTNDALEEMADLKKKEVMQV